MTRVCCSQSPSPRGRPLLTCASTGDTQTFRSGSVCVGSGSWCTQGFVCALWTSLVGLGFGSKCDFTPPTILLGLLLCPWMWGIFFWCNPTFSCQWYSAASCNFGVLPREDEPVSFYSTILLEYSSLISSKQTTRSKKVDVNRNFSKENTQMTKTHMKRCWHC